MKKAFVVDFDGTITKKDVGADIVESLTDQSWRRFEDKWQDRKIGCGEYTQIKWGSMKYDDAHLKSYVSKFTINKGFDEFLTRIREKSCKMIIASDGYDVYIREILKEKFYELNIICNEASYRDGWRLSFPNGDDKCNRCGNCKKNIVQKLKNDGYKVYYIGDGESDKCASLYADKIFAKDTLKKHCEEQNVEYHSFNDFHDILKHI